MKEVATFAKELEKSRPMAERLRRHWLGISCILIACDS